MPETFRKISAQQELRARNVVASPAAALVPQVIESFSGEWRFLSNFSPARVRLDKLTFPTVEHAYQAAKTLDVVERKILLDGTPGMAKKAGRRFTLRPGWDDMRNEVMLDLLWQKFSPLDMRRRLIGTYPAKIIEGNTWGDRYWGVYMGEGENWLGRLISGIRDVLVLADNGKLLNTRQS